MREMQHLVLLSMTGLAGAGLVTTGTYSLLTSSADATSDAFAAGTVQIQVWDGNSANPPDPNTSEMSPPETSAEANRSAPQYFYPGTEQTQQFTVKNSGSLSAWVGLVDQLPAHIPLAASYTVRIYAPGQTQTASRQPLQQYDEDWSTVSDAVPSTPFVLPAGDYAEISYQYKLGAQTPTRFQHQSDTLQLEVWAVQFENNVNPAGTGPMTWDANLQAADP